MTVEEMLIEYNANPDNTRIKEYYEQDNTWKALGVERDENRHSKFLAWLLNKDFDAKRSPLFLLLNLLIRNGVVKNGVGKFDGNLKKAILLNNLVITAVEEIMTEKPIKDLSVIEFSDRLDIYIRCHIEGVDGYNSLEIFIENKVKSTENGKKNTIEDKNKVLTDIKNRNDLKLLNLHKAYIEKHQTERYYFACSKDNRKHEQGLDFDKTIQLFVFLTAKGDKPECDKFITITYQDLVDYVIQPYLEGNLVDNNTSYILKDYLLNLSNPLNNDLLTMAMTEDEKKLLLKFWEGNKELFFAAAEAASNDDSLTDEERESLNASIITLKATEQSITRRFSINGVGEYTMYNQKSGKNGGVLNRFVEFRLRDLMADANKSFEDAINEINDDISTLLGGKSGKHAWVATNVDKCYGQQDQNRTRHGEAKCTYNGQEETYYFSTQWGANDKGNFIVFMNAVNKKYRDKFLIESIL